MRAIIISRDSVKRVHGLVKPSRPSRLEIWPALSPHDRDVLNQDYEAALDAWEEAETPIKIHPDLLDYDRKIGNTYWHNDEGFWVCVSDVMGEDVLLEGFEDLNEWIPKTKLTRFKPGTEWEVSIKDNLVVEINPIKE